MIIKSEMSEIENYLTDAANFRGSCEKVYIPDSEEELIEAVKECYSNNCFITIAGNGTGLTGGRVPEKGAVISTEKLNKIFEINAEDKYACLQSGVVLSDFQTELNSRGLFYPPDPTETNCFIGATVSTNASGAKSFKYGSTRNFVCELKIVLANGDRLFLKRGENLSDGKTISVTSAEGNKYSFEIPEFVMPDTKHAAGYFCKGNMDAIDLFIGSEGTLGIITEVKVRVMELPKAILSAVIFFDEADKAIDFIEEAKERSKKSNDDKSEIDALGLEFFDEKSLAFLSDEFSKIPSEAKAAVWFEQEYSEDNEEKILELWFELILKHNGNEETAWFASDNKDRHGLQQFRHAVSWKVSEYIARKGIKKVGTDTAVPWNKFREYYSYSLDVVEQNGLDYISYGHFGDAHLHLNMLPENEEQYLQAREIYGLLCRKAVELGGTVSAEHGIGKLKKEYLEMMFGEKVISKMAEIKTTFDPLLLLNHGNLFDEKHFGK